MNLHGLGGAVRDWDVEVCSEAERLIELGVAPWDAVIQARQRVSARRRCKAYPEDTTDSRPTQKRGTA